MPKKLKGGAFGFFQHPFCRKTLKKIEGVTEFEILNEVQQCFNASRIETLLLFFFGLK